jgi:hypothetical protein
MIHQFVNVTGRIVATERGEMAIPECIADAEADCGTPAVLPSMPFGENADLDLDHVQPAAGTTLTRDSTCQIHCAAVQPPRGKTGYPFVDGYQCVGDRLWHMSFCQGSQESPDAEEFHDRRCPNACTVEFRRCRSPGCQHADAGECYEGCVGVRSVPMRVETGMARSCAGIRCLGAASSARVLLREAPPSLG